MTALPAARRLLTRKSALGETVQDLGPAHDLAAGEAVLKLDRFSITANNITYAVFGDAMQYWSFFPTGDPALGHMPVWGFANVIASTVPGVEVGERFYGYFPIASHLVMRPERATGRGFFDGAEHRKALVSAYNQYTRCSEDAGYAPATENLQALYRPLFITAFMLADHVVDNEGFGARRLLVSSASSKTAYGTAACLDGAGFERIGLTSGRNTDFVEGLGCYDRVVDYAAIEALPADQPVTYLDFSGDPELRARIHHHFADALVHDCVIGSAGATKLNAPVALPGPRPQFFFAPNQIAKRNTDWGPAEFNRRYGEAERAFFARAADPANPWMRVVEHAGFDAAAGVIADLHAGRADPLEGHIVVLD